MVRTRFVEKLKYDTLDTLIAVGSYNVHTRVELFTLSSLKWQNKKDYPLYATADLYGYSILAVERKFIVFGGRAYNRKVLTKQDKELWKHLDSIVLL